MSMVYSTGRDDLALVVSPVPGGVVVAVAVVTTGNLGVAPLVERSLLGHALLDSSHHLAAGVDDGDGHVRRPCQAVVNGGRLVGHPGITGEDVRFRTRSTEEPQETAASDWRWSPSAGWGRSRTGLHPGDR